MERSKPIPKMEVGRYAGVQVDKLPNSYLRWLITQDFPKEIIEVAREKLSNSDYNDTYMSISRHAIDMFSKRFLGIWLHEQKDKGADGTGLASFMVELAELAWINGKDTTLNRHQSECIRKDYDSIRWVFAVSKDCPDYKEVITVMPTD